MEGPYIHTKNDHSKIMKNILIALIPLILFALYKNSIVLLIKGNIDFSEAMNPIILLLICSLSTFLFETLYILIFHKSKHSKLWYSFIPGIILGLIIPIQTPILVIIISCFISIVISKLFFGGYNKSLLNQVALAFLVINIFSIMNGGYSYLNSYEKTKYTTSPISIAEKTKLNITYDEAVLPYGYLKQFFVGNVPGGIGEVSILFCIISFIYLTTKKSIKHLIPISILSTLILGFTLFAVLNNQSIWFVLFNTFIGSIVFASIFVASNNPSSPITELGQIIYGIIIGILTIIFRFFIPIGGIFISILIANLFVPIIDNIVAQHM